MTTFTDYSDPFGDYAGELAEQDAQDHFNAEQYAEGARYGEQAGREAFLAGIETTRAYNPDRTPFLDGWDDGFCAGYNMARNGR